MSIVRVQLNNIIWASGREDLPKTYRIEVQGWEDLHKDECFVIAAEAAQEDFDDAIISCRPREVR